MHHFCQLPQRLSSIGMIDNITCNQIKSSSLFSPPGATRRACCTTSPAATLSLSKVFIYQLPTDAPCACCSRSCRKTGTNGGRRSGAQADEGKGGGVMEMKLKLIKKQTNKPPQQKSLRELMCSLTPAPEEKEIKKKKTEERCLKRGTRLCTADIFTPLCAGSKAVQLPLRFM